MNLFKNFFRGFVRNRQMTILNVLGLVTGLSCCLLMTLWILFQYRTDRCYPHADRIVTVSGFHKGSSAFHGAPPAVAPTLAQELPEVEDAVRLCWAAMGFVCEGESYGLTALDVDAAFFDFFGCDLIDGSFFGEDDKQLCVITHKVASEIAPHGSALGKTLEFDFGKFIVAGIIRDLPANTTVGQFGDGPAIFLPILRNGEELTAWYNNSFETYLRLKDPVHLAEFAQKIRNRAYEAKPEYNLYLTSDLLVNRNLYTYKRIESIRVMGIIALVVLLIACINFVNLTTAGFTRTSFQTGLRKILGASRGELILQQLFNTFLLVIFSFLLAIGVSILIFPFFNAMLGENLSLKDMFTPSVAWVGAIIVIVTSLLAGLYPALYISSFKPLTALRGTGGGGRWNAGIRLSLVVIQFSVSIVMIISTLVVMQQIRMFNRMNLGYAHDEVVYISLRNEAQRNAGVALREELLKNPDIQSVSRSTSVPSHINWNGVGWTWVGIAPGESPLMTFNYTDPEWANVYGLRFSAGSYFSDSLSGVVINRKLEEMMNVTTAIGQYLERDGKQYRIVGVLDNFMFNDFKKATTPVIILPLEEWTSPQIISVRGSGDIQKLYADIYQTAEQILGEKPVVRFLNYNIERLLTAEKETSKIVSFFSVLAIIISCLGLFGLATFMIEQKRKEIGIRRVNGARVREIIWLLNIDFIRPVMIGFVIACPLAWYVLKGWLEGYEQRISMSWWIFASAGILTLGIAVFTLIWRTWFAATENPVNVLKNE